MNPRPGDPRFYTLLEEIAALHGRKSADYAPGSDPLANFRASAEFGVRPYLGVLTRLRDKWGRLTTAAKGGALLNESIKDSHIDSAVYHLIAVMLLEDEALPTGGNCWKGAAYHERVTADGSACPYCALTEEQLQTSDIPDSRIPNACGESAPPSPQHLRTSGAELPHLLRCDNCAVARASGFVSCSACWAVDKQNPKNRPPDTPPGEAKTGADLRQNDKRYCGEDGDPDHEYQPYGHGV